MIIGLLGKKGSGKDTIAKYFIEEYGFVRYAFGDKVKEVVKVLFDFTDQQLFTWMKEKKDLDWNITPRKAFQVVGTDFAQYFLPENMPELKEVLPNPTGFWVKHFMVWYQRQIRNNPNIKLVISDVRFMHEVEAIKKLGGYIWKVERNDSIYGVNDFHISESGIEDIDNNLIDTVISNNSTIDKLHQYLNNLSFMLRQEM